jgi:large subunit ribosomal protein L5
MLAKKLQVLYKEEMVTSLKDKLGLKNVHAVPQLNKIVINIGLGKAIQDPKLIQVAQEELAKITGQRPVVTKAKKAISNFKLRKGMPIGCMVTLRKQKMYEFMERLVHVALPRVRDFKGISPKSFDKEGNYTLGIKDHSIFPEVDIDKIDSPLGMNISFITTANNKEEAHALLSELGMPFRK